MRPLHQMREGRRGGCKEPVKGGFVHHAKVGRPILHCGGQVSCLESGVHFRLRTLFAHGCGARVAVAQERGMTNIAVLEKTWIGGGNTGRNTTNVRSDDMFSESAAMYDFALRLHETLGRDLNDNIMLSQRGWLTLIHNQHLMETARHKANWRNCNGVDGEITGAEKVHKMLPMMNMSDNPRYPVRGAFLQKRGGTIRHDAVTWGYARASDRLGVDIIQNCAVEGFDFDGDRIVAMRTAQGRIETGRVGVAVAGHSCAAADMAGIRLPITSHCRQAMVGLVEGLPDRGGDDGVLAARDMRQGVPHPVDATALPPCAEDLARGGLEALTVTADHQLHAPQPAPGQRAQKLGRESLCLAP
jgi:hypothetical protein